MVLVKPPRFRVRGSLNLTAHPQPRLEQDRREREWRTHIQGFPDLMVSDNYTSVHILLARTIAPCTPRNIPLLLFFKIVLICSSKVQASQCGGFSCGAVASPVEHRLRGRGLQELQLPALEHRLGGCGTLAQLSYSLWDPPGSGVKSTSPSLAGGFFTTEPFLCLFFQIKKKLR